MTTHPLAKRRRWRSGRILLAASALAVISIGGGATPASATATSTMLYSTDGGTTWSSSATVPASGTVLVRQWYNNTGTTSETGASLATSIPSGFTRQTGSTKICLSPQTTSPSSPTATEQTCANSAEGSVWSGSALQISPSAGFYGDSNGATSGALPFGRKRYLNIHQCVWGVPGTLTDRTTTLTDVASGSAWDAGTNVSNTADAAPTCGAGAGAWGLTSGQTGVEAIDLLGNSTLNLHQCHYTTSGGEDRFSSVIDTISGTAFSAGTNASNTVDTAPVCGAGNGTRSIGPNTTGTKALDIASNRYLHLAQCSWSQTSPVTPPDPERATTFIDTVSAPAFRANTSVSNSSTSTTTCGSGNGSYVADASFTGLKTFDLLDAARARGFAQYALTAPAKPSPAACANNFQGTEAFTQNGSYTSTQTATKSYTGNLTVDFSAVTDPCPTNPIPAVDPVVGGALLATAGAGYLLYRSRKVQVA